MSTLSQYKLATPPLIPGTEKYTALRVSNMEFLSNDTIKDVQQIDILQAPVNPTDGVNKAYVDSQSGGSPGNPDTSIQYNDSGTFAGSGTFTYNSGTDTVTATNISLNTGTVSTTPTASTDIANKAYVDAATGSAPGGPAQAVQFNSSPAGVFTGSSDFVWDDVLKTLTINGTVVSDNFITTSSVLMKNNIEPLSDPLNQLKQIEGVSYNFQNNEDRTYGVIAENVENAGLNNLVKNMNGIKRVDYTQFIPMLIEACKKLDTENKEMKEELKSVQERVDRRRRRSRKTFKDTSQSTFKPFVPLKRQK